MEGFIEISNRLQEKKDELFIKYAIKELAIFGSYSRGEETKESDIDIMVEFIDSIGIEFIDLAEELEEILDRKVDLVSKKGIKTKYFEEIKEELKYV